jgi:hypothetical protein
MLSAGKLTTGPLRTGNRDFLMDGLGDLGGNIYAGTKAASGEAAVYRWDGGTDWTKVSDDNWGNDYVTYVLSLIEYKGDLYAGTKPVNLYRYDGEDDWTKIGSTLNWDGIKCLYDWDGVLYLGDSYHDLIAHYAPPTIPTLTYIYGSGGSCIWDFQLYHDRLYASAYSGVIYRSEEDDGSSWDEWTDLGSDNVWELEEYQDKLFIAAGYELYYYEAEDEGPGASIWEIPSEYRQYGEEIISMLSTGDYLCIGTGSEFSWSYSYYSTGKTYVYDGVGDPEDISDGLNTSGIQCLLMVNP